MMWTMPHKSSGPGRLFIRRDEIGPIDPSRRIVIHIFV